MEDDSSVDKYSLGEGDSRDDEEELWKAFFDKLQPAREAVEGAREKFRNSILGGAIDTLGQLADDAADIANSFSRRLTELAYSLILRSPGIIVAFLLLLTAAVGQYAFDFQQQIDGDLEIYLPDNADSTELLIEVREDWSTDVVMVYMQTGNAIHDTNLRTEQNITSLEVLKQMSWIEGDDSSPAGTYVKGLDWDKSDRGLNDGVIWVLSPAQVIKEANSSSWRFNCAMEKYGLPTSDDESCTIASLNPYYGYEIPDEQDRVDEFVENAGSLIESMVRDTNDDGIWDTGVIVMGITFDMSTTEIPVRVDPKLGPVRDHEAFLDFTEDLIHGPTSLDFCSLCHVTYERTSTMDPTRLDDIPPRRAVTVTGITPVLHDISDEIYLELVETMLPASLALVALAMIILHRNAKVLVICGLPIAMSLFITFGTTVVADITLTPMIISAGPILVGLGVDYSLHLTNRIEENRVELIEEGIENAWRQQRDGREADSIDPWDPLISLTATVRAAMTTGNAIFLSAVTTIIGFSVLTWDSLVPIEPMRTVGTTLLLGISVTFLLSMLMVPALVQLLRYRRGTEVMEMSPMQTVYVALALGALAAVALSYTELMTTTNAIILSSMLTITIVIGSLDSVWEYVGEIPVKATIIVLLVGSVATIGGAIIFEDQMGQGITGGSDQVPPGIESYEALREYSYEFGGGQTNLFIVNATDRGPQNGTAPIRDLPVLDSLEEIQAKIDNVERTNTTSIVNILKAIHIQIGVDAIDRSLWDMLHSPCWDDPLQLECIASGDAAFTTTTSREDMVNVAFDTLSPEVRSMLMNSDEGPGETKTLVYAWQPYILLEEATPLRDTIDGFLSEGGCETAIRCSSMTISDEGVTNSKLTGGLPISIDINEGIHTAQSDSTIMTMFILLFAMAILFRSPRMAIFTMTAVAAVVLWQPILMWRANLGVNIFTAMIGTIVFGIGVDDSIHIVDRIKDEGETPAGIVRSVMTTGRTIFETTATTCAGLAAGLFVAIPGLQTFFLLMMALIALALLTSAILLPTIIVIYNEFKSRITLNGSWLDYDEVGTIETSSVADAIIE
ncbi:MAG: MMPL family transporter [Candidatus Thermoplasmatota archaeon]|nr:MMPL family transporter [Candidatus Thermoplasmatota archaeon]MED5274036.1 MMPL family transporter [Candidatus Thermoplasmatota archaeon]